MFECVHTFIHYISETSGPITIKYYLKHHWGRGKAALGVGADRLRTLFPWQQIASIVTIGQTVPPLFLGRILFILVGNEDMHEVSDEFEIWSDLTTNCGVSCL